MLIDDVNFFTLSAILLAVLTLPGILLLAALTIAGTWPVRRPEPAQPGTDGRIALVVPAHNEGLGIARTIDNLMLEAAVDGDAEVIVIADNCSDATASVSRSRGARVIERCDEVHRGKGYALDFAFGQLLRDDFRYFVVIDADSLVDSGFLATLRRHFASGAMALQTRYTVLNANDTMRTRLMEVALSAFNVLRPRGRWALGCSAGLLGNGFGLRREVLERLPYTAGSVVEDLEYHLVLVWHGVQVAFVDDTAVRGEMPSGGPGVRSQRTRWEGGRLRMMIDHAPGLLHDLMSGRSGSLEPLLDLLLLPLSYHVVLLTLLMILPLDWAFALGLIGLIGVALHVLAAAYVGRLTKLHFIALLGVPIYVIWKLLLIPATLAAASRNSPWIRTMRESLREGVKP